jgi:diacylglycerol O-acyltransferase
MRQLSGMDAAYLALDSATVATHLGCLCVIDPPADGPALSLRKLTELVASKLPLLPPFRRRLAEVPFGLDQPYWVEDPDFDIGFHVRELTLPEPGNDRQLAAAAAGLHERPLDRTRPLWQIHLIHGLASGQQAAYMKVHHAAIDGIAGSNLLVALLDLAPQPYEAPVVDPWRPDTEPGALRLLARSVGSAARQPRRLARLSADVLRLLPDLVNSPARPRFLAPHTPFNNMLGPRRRWAFGSLPMSRVEQVKNSAGVTVNDVVLALCAGALRRWLSDHHTLPAGPLLAGVPVSTRTNKHTATEGNQLSKVVAPLPTHVCAPAERLRAAHEAMGAAKEQFHGMPTDVLTDIAECTMPAVAKRVSRLASRVRLLEHIRPLNLFVSNVPGPSMEMYIGGARLDAVYPLSTIADGQGLNITVVGSFDKLTIGILADPEQVPDVEAIIDGIVDELDLLHAAFGSRAVGPADAAQAEPAF